jgi:GNAT superfamily N-acetyltransferase
MIFREATREDVPAVIALLQDDGLGAQREIAGMEDYLAAFDRMQAEPGNRIYVGEDDGRVVATYQLVFIAGLSRRAARRALVESVRVASDQRGRGLGALLMEDAEGRARKAGCSLMQLTTHRTRDRAHQFYERLGYAQSHFGYKKML